MSARAGRARLDPDELAALEEQRDFLLASLADLEREHAAGDLGEEDLANLRDEYTARAAEVLRAIDEQRLAFAAAKPPRNVARTAATIVGVAAFALLSGWVVARSMGARKAGETASGGISVKETLSQRAQKCIPLIDQTAPKEALACFAEIREEDPDNVVALTWSSWQLSLAAEEVGGELGASLNETASGLLTKAVAIEPEYSQARAFRAVVAFRGGQLDDAEQFLQDFYDHDPDADSSQTLQSMDLQGQIEAARKAQEGAGDTTTTTAPGAPTTTTTAPPG